ncbi:MAG: hypothetical protein HUK20_06000 [Fibrobacter sp.]|nr:hypothetical protein [Fibrobacter sp.]
MKDSYNRKRNHIFNHSTEGMQEKQDRKWMKRHHIKDPEHYNVIIRNWHYPVICDKCGKFISFGSSSSPIKSGVIESKMCHECHPEFFTKEYLAECKRNSDKIKAKFREQLELKLNNKWRTSND